MVRAASPSIQQTLTRPNRGLAMKNLRNFSAWHIVAPPLVFLAMVAVVGVFNANYLSPFGISIVAGTAAPILLVAVGQAMVLNIGSIDLSNAAISMLGAIILALVVPKIGVLGIVVVLILMTLVGAINGAVLAWTQVPSFALTLGTLGILQTAALVISDSQTIYLSQNREMMTVFYNTNIAFIPLTFWIGTLLAVAYWVLLRFTILGQNMTAIGKNESGAILSAVPHQRVKIVTFAISGFTAALAGLCIVAQAGSASASGIGSNLLLPGIAAALVGGTSISGGLTNPLNVICGALTVAFVPVAIQALGFSAQAQSLVYGIFIILVVALTTTRSRGLVIK
jgi:ribose transport system permease protein